MNLARLRIASIDFSRAPISQCVEVRNLLRRLASCKVVCSELFLNAGSSCWISREGGEDSEDYHFALLTFSKKFPNLIFEVTIYDQENESLIVERAYYRDGSFGKAKIEQTVPTPSETPLKDACLQTDFNDLIKRLEEKEAYLKNRENGRTLAAKARAKLTPDELSALLTFPT